MSIEVSGQEGVWRVEGSTKNSWEFTVVTTKSWKSPLNPSPQSPHTYTDLQTRRPHSRTDRPYSGRDWDGWRNSGGLNNRHPTCSSEGFPRPRNGLSGSKRTQLSPSTDWKTPGVEGVTSDTTQFRTLHLSSRHYGLGVGKTTVGEVSDSHY